MTDLTAIRERRAAIADQRASLDREDAELVVAERVLARMAGEEPAPVNAFVATRRKAMSMSRRELVMEAMTDGPMWQTSKDINFAIARKHGFHIKSTSFFPMLTALKNEGVILRDGDKMALKSRLDGEGGPI